MNSRIEEFIKLVQANPELTVYTMVDNEIVPDDEYGRWFSKIGTCSIDSISEYGDKTYFDEDDLKEDIADNVYSFNQDITDVQLEIEVDEIFSKISWESVILLNIDTL